MLSKNNVKLPLKKPIDENKYMNINRSEAPEIGQTIEITMHGRPYAAREKMDNVLRHDYLRKSMVERIERKSLIKQHQ